MKKYIITFLSGAFTWHILLLAFDTFRQRQGTLGGEVLVVPLLVLTFYMGWMVRSEVEKMKGEVNDEIIRAR